jgi:RHS repeat-associated protein
MTEPNRQSPIRQRTLLLAMDLKNSVLAEIDAGNPNCIAYSPYGQQSAQLEVMTRLGFNGELREANPEWYLLGNGYRAYNPRLMRFHSPDSLSPFGKGGRNAYMYCGGDPVMHSDPTGHTIWALSRFVQTLTDTVEHVVTPVLRKTASLANSGVSQVLGAAKSAKKAFADNFLFDPEALKKLGPPPPKFKQQQPSNYVVTQSNPHAGPNSVRAQQTRFVPKTRSGLRITGTTEPTKRVSALRKGS